MPMTAADPDREPDPIRAARVELAAAYRLAARFGFNEGIDNHFTLMVPGARDRFLLNAFGLHWSEVTASNLIAVDFDGHVVEGRGEAEATAYFIHSRIHRAHPRARCVLHTHMPYATALTAIQGGRLEPVGINALRFNGVIAYDGSSRRKRTPRTMVSPGCLPPSPELALLHTQWRVWS